MDPIIILVVTVLVLLAIIYKDISAFLFLGIVVSIWTAIMFVAFGLMCCGCYAVEGIKYLKRK